MIYAYPPKGIIDAPTSAYQNRRSMWLGKESLVEHRHSFRTSSWRKVLTAGKPSAVLCKLPKARRNRPCRGLSPLQMMPGYFGRMDVWEIGGFTSPEKVLGSKIGDNRNNLPQQISTLSCLLLRQRPVFSEKMGLLRLRTSEGASSKLSAANRFICFGSKGKAMPSRI